jgi:isopentenyldiphosphate isomerase
MDINMKNSFPVVNKKNKYVYTAYSEDELHKKDEYCRTVHVLVEVFGGNFLLQKKAEGVKKYGGKWSSAVSGYIRHTEGCREAAIRELNEGLGLKVKQEDIYKITIVSPSKNNSNEFISVFTYLMDPKEELHLNKKKISEVVIDKLQNIIKDVKSYRNEYAPDFVEVLNMFLVLEKGIEGDNNG